MENSVPKNLKKINVEYQPLAICLNGAILSFMVAAGGFFSAGFTLADFNTVSFKTKEPRSVICKEKCTLLGAKSRQSLRQ
jgi:hypothetical protein